MSPPRKKKHGSESEGGSLVLTRENVTVSSLRYRKGGDFGFDPRRYSIDLTSSLRPEVVALLLKIHPIIVVHEQRHMEVVYGSRLFQVAAFSLNEDAVISVLVLDKKRNKAERELLQYFDHAVMPLLDSLSASPADVWSLVSLPDGEKVWQPQVRTVAGLARRLGITPAAIHISKAKVKRGQRKGDAKGEASDGA